MKNKTVLWLPPAALSLLVSGLAQSAAVAAPPKPDFDHLPAYVQALNASHDPQAQAIRRELAGGPAALTRARADAKRAGIILDRQTPMPIPPPGENAAPLYERWEKWERQKSTVPLPLYANPMEAQYAYTPTQVTAVRRIFAAQPERLTLLHEATDRPLCVFGSQGNGSGSFSGFMTFPNVAPLRGAARELRTESYLLARQGRYAEAVANDARIFHVADQAASAHSLIAFLTANAIEAIGRGGMADILYLAGPNVAIAEQVERAVQQDSGQYTLKAAWAGEVAIGAAQIEAIGTPATLKLPTLVKAAVDAAGIKPPSRPRISQAEAHFLRNVADAAAAEEIPHLLRVVAAAGLPPAARRAAFRRIDQANAAAKRRPGWANDPIHTLVGMMTLDAAVTGQRDDERRAHEAVLIAGAAVLAARARTGSFPARLPLRIADPFTDGKPLLYRREGATGFVVYSVGAAGHFDGGKPGEHHWKTYDIAFRYPGPTPVPLGK